MLRLILFCCAFCASLSLMAQKGDTGVRPDPMHPSLAPQSDSSVRIAPLEEKKPSSQSSSQPSASQSLLLLEGDLQAQMKFYQKPEGPEQPPLPHPANWEQCTFDAEQSNLKRKQLIWRPFFSYTPEKYSDYFKKSAFLSCEGALAKEEEMLFLYLRIHIGTPLGVKAYGAIAPNSALYLKQLNGTNILLRTPGGASGQAGDDETLYEVRYRLERSDVRALRESEIDQVRIDWSVGYEAYEVYYVDFLWDQLDCFD